MSEVDKIGFKRERIDIVFFMCKSILAVDFVNYSNRLSELII